MSNQNKDITFGQLFGVFKKSLKRGLIYILITAIVATAVLLSVKAFTDTKVYSTSITFSEVSENMLPRLNANKSVIINKALEKTGKPIGDSLDVTNNLSVSAVEINSENADSNYIPTSFNLTLKPTNELGYTSSEYKELLDNIANEYALYFSQRELQTVALNVSTSLLSSIEYIDRVFTLSSVAEDYIEILENYLADFDELGDFTSDTSRKTVKDVIATLYLCNTQLGLIKDVIVANKIEKSTNGLLTELNSEKQKRDMSVDALTSQKDVVDTAIVNYKEILTNVKKDDNGNNQYFYDDSGYLALVQQSVALAGKIESAKKAVAIITNDISNIGSITDTPDNELVEKTKIDIITAYEQINSCVNDYNVLAEEYNASQQKSSVAKQINPAHSALEGVIGVKLIVVVLVAALLIAYIVAYSQTYVKLKANGYFEQ